PLHPRGEPAPRADRPLRGRRAPDRGRDGEAPDPGLSRAGSGPGDEPGTAYAAPAANATGDGASSPDRPDASVRAADSRAAARAAACSSATILVTSAASFGVSNRLKPTPTSASASTPIPRNRPRVATWHISSYSSGQPTRRRW